MIWCTFLFLSCFAGVNYRTLTDESSDPLATLQPVLTSQNVLSISKLANRLPLPGGGGATVSPSAVHAVWLQKLFWKGDPQLLKRPPQSDQDYLHAYDTCAKYFDRLEPADAIHFLDSITFSPDAAKNVSIVHISCHWFPMKDCIQTEKVINWCFYLHYEGNLEALFSCAISGMGEPGIQYVAAVQIVFVSRQPCRQDSYCT